MMFFELIATIVAGVGAGGLAMGVDRLTGRRLPKGIVPIAAGLAMIAFAIWSEYAWFDRARGALAPGSVVIAQNEARAAWRPWTYAAPLTTRFAAVDPAAVTPLSDRPDTFALHVRLVERWKPVMTVPIAVDCAGSRRADLVGVNDLDQARWLPIRGEEPLFQAICQGQD